MPVYAQEVNSGQEAAGAQQAKMSPVETYAKAWEIVNEKFYDPTFGGQDWTRWQHKYDKQIQNFDDAQLAILTMIASLGDKYSRFIPPQQFNDEKDQIVARFGGVGLYLGLTETKEIEVVAPIQRTPAFRAGLQSGDRIVSINHKMAPHTVEEAVNLIRGQQKTPVLLTISRDGEKRDVSLIRDDIPVFCVFDARMLDKNIGYIRIDSLVSTIALNDVLQNLSNLKSAKGLIVDLRGNPGGLFANGIDVATVFLKDGVIVSTVGRNGTLETCRVDKARIPKSVHRDLGTLPLYEQPLVVIIDGSTSQSAEILAAALKDNGRAEIIGEKSRGKGLGQGIFRLPYGGGINLSTFRYLSPLNTDLILGVTPNYPVPLSEADKSSGRGPWYTYGSGVSVHGGRTPANSKDIQLTTAVQVLKQRLISKA